MERIIEVAKKWIRGTVRDGGESFIEATLDKNMLERSLLTQKVPKKSMIPQKSHACPSMLTVYI